jgi:hypothetical protein
VSRIHGRNGVAYVAVTGPGSNISGGGLGTAAASPVAFLSDWSINFTVNKVDVTAMTDPNLLYVAGLPDASGDFSGFYDTATAQTYAAAVDGLSRNFYLYPSIVGSQGAAPGQYFFGTILPDYAISGGVTSAVSLKSTWNAASSISRYPSTGIAGS